MNYSVAANTGSAARSATLTVGSATFTLTQSGACTFDVSPASRGSSRGRYRERHGDERKRMLVDGHTIGILDHDYQRLSGTGSGTVNYRVSAYTGSSSRTGSLTVAGQPVTVTQSGVTTTPNAPVGLRIVGR